MSQNELYVEMSQDELFIEMSPDELCVEKSQDELCECVEISPDELCVEWAKIRSAKIWVKINGEWTTFFQIRNFGDYIWVWIWFLVA